MQKLATLKAAASTSASKRARRLADKVKTATGGRGADLIVNCVGGSVFPECVRALAYEGRLATVGYVDGVLKSEIDLGALHANRYTLFGVSNAKLAPAQRAETVRGFVREVLPAIADGRITPLIYKVFFLMSCRLQKPASSRTRTSGKSSCARPADGRRALGARSPVSA